MKLPPNFKRPPQQSLEAWKHVNGWLTLLDLYLLDRILVEQSQRGFVGDVLEIGCYQGKSAIVLSNRLKSSETMVVCDNFGVTDKDENLSEINRSYETKYRTIFQENFERFSTGEPRIHATDSRELPALLQPASFRLIHIDGSHLLEYARKDIATSIDALSPGGVIVLDDFRSQHTPGVALALWESVSLVNLQPFLLTARKAYCCRPGEIPAFMQTLEGMLADMDVHLLKEVLGQSSMTITLEDETEWGFTPKRARDLVLPPVTRSWLRGLKFHLAGVVNRH